MIQWSLSLSQHQIAVLECLEHREFGKPFDYPTYLNHWISHTRSLEAEGLVEHKSTKNAQGYNDGARTGHFITERGRFILNMIREDMKRFVDSKPKTRRASA